MPSEIPKISSQISFLYIEYARIEQDNSSIIILRKGTKTTIPLMAISCLILGQGTTITHKAIEALQEGQCLVVWSGEQMRTFYASGMQEERSSEHILKQSNYLSDPEKHLLVARRMYQKRFPDKDMGSMNIQNMRGAEGLRMHNLYEQKAKQYNVVWSGRVYNQDNWDDQSDINKALTVGNKLLYNVCHAAILAMGYSPVLGFIHTGTMRSFVYDIADLYKAEIVIDTAFRLLSQGYTNLEEEMRTHVREAMHKQKLLKQLSKDIPALFDEKDVESKQEGLWDGLDSVVSGGKNWSGDGSNYT